MIANSHSVAGDARKVLPAALKIQVVHNGVDVDLFTPVGACAEKVNGPWACLAVVASTSSLSRASEICANAGLSEPPARHDVMTTAVNA